MILSFAYYDENNVMQRENFTAKETDIKINYSDLNFTSNTGKIAWEGTGTSRFLTNDRSHPVGIYVGSCSGTTRQKIESLFNFTNEPNVIRMTSYSNWHDKYNTISNYEQGDATTIPINFGKSMYVEKDGVYSKLCTFQWFNYLDLGNIHTGQNTYFGFNGGFMYFKYADNPQGIYTPHQASLYPTFSDLYPPILALYIITIVDDVQSSPTYQQEFPVLIQCFSYQRYPEEGTTQSSIPARFTITDLRLLEGTGAKPTTQNPNKNSRVNGWGGTRNTFSNEDSITGISASMQSLCNFGEHGIFLYKLDRENMSNLSASLWSNSLYDKIKDYKFSPSSGILSVLMLPYVPASTGTKEAIRICGTTAFFTETDFSSVGGISLPILHPTATYAEGTPIEVGTRLASEVVASGSMPKGEYIEPFFNSFLDFEPYTRVSIRLPFIGTVPVPTASVMGGLVYVQYLCDNRNGNVVAQIYSKTMRNTEDDKADKWMLIGQYSGNCAMPMALTGNSMGATETVGAIKGFASNAAGTLIDTNWSKGKDVVDAEKSLAKSGIGLALDLGFSRWEPRLVGSLSANTTPMTDLSCRIIIQRPFDVMPLRFSNGELTTDSVLLDEQGLAAYGGGTVGDYKGFTRGIVMGNITSATDAECNKIKELFASGVIIKQEVS